MPRFSDKNSRSRLRRSAAGRLIAALSLGSLLLLSCATIPPAERTTGWLDVLPPLTPDSLYASVDVPSSWSLLQALAEAAGSETDELQRLVANLDRVHVRIRLSPGASPDESPATVPELSLIALGKFSPGPVARRLNRDPVWQRVMLEQLPGRGFTSSHWSYRTCWRKGEFQIAAPSRGILFLTVGVPADGDPAGAEALLRRLHTPEAQPLPAPLTLEQQTADIFFYLPDPAALVSSGSASATRDPGDLLKNLPIRQGWVRGERLDFPEGEEGYELEVVFLLAEVDSPRSVELLLRLILTLWLRRVQVEDPVETLKAVTFRADSESARIESLFLTAGEIASFIRTLLPENLLAGERP
jgi:hypothetical protein